MSETVFKVSIDKLLPLHEAVKHALDVEMHPSTFHRWAIRVVRGANGLRYFLNHRRVGAKLMCTIQDVLDFDANINQRLEAKLPPKRTPGHDKRVKERLKALGII